LNNGLTSGLRRFQLKASITSFLLILFLYYYPVINGVKDAFTGSIQAILENRVVTHSLVFTFEQAFASTIASLAIGVPAGIALITLSTRASRITRTLLLTAFMSPSMVVVMGFTSLYGDNGILSSHIPLLSKLGQGYSGIIAAHVFYNAPLIAVMVYNSLESIPREHWDLILSTSKPSSRALWRKIVLPYAKSGALSGSLLAFIYCFMSFAIPLNIGGPRYSTLEVDIYMYYKILQNPAVASAIALLQYIILLLIVTLMMKASITTPHAPLSTSVEVRLSPRITLAAKIYTILLSAYLAAPIIGALYYSIYNPVTGQYTLSYYRHVLSIKYDPRLGLAPIDTLLNSLYYAFMTVLLSLGIATIVSIGYNRINDALIVSLLAVSPITLGLGLLRTIPPWIPVWVAIVLAHTFAGMPLALRSIRIGLERVSRKYIEASISLGETFWGTLFRVAIPIAKHSYLTAAALAAAISLGEFSATLFLRTVKTTTLVVAIYQYRALRLFGEAYAASGVLILLTIIVVYTIARLEGGKGG
jgi:thiamine transport system permease protein